MTAVRAASARKAAATGRRPREEGAGAASASSTPDGAMDSVQAAEAVEVGGVESGIGPPYGPGPRRPPRTAGSGAGREGEEHGQGWALRHPVTSSSADHPNPVKRM
ncbi:hypothetical protein GCM10010211_43680 [Streptomyces albospinus]|uniref:Uncharacterized protein n=1 Tax=Streptomyces albospinus TaxID=285515 RepID=A0ABQ2V9K1_9ACTN|nr:hypothetical protein GCM10010211_43680 [Streptomyces albospinus]